MKKFILIILVVILLFGGCAVPKAGSVPSVSSSLPSASSAVSSYISIPSLPTGTVVSSSQIFAVSSKTYSPSTESEGNGEPMTQAEFDDFFENVLPEVMVLLCGEETCDPNDSVQIDGVTYYKITDEKYNTVEKLKTEFAKYFTVEFIDQFFDSNFGYQKPYKEKEGTIYAYDNTIGATHEFDRKDFSRGSDRGDFINLYHTVQNGADPSLHFVFTMKHVDGEWKIGSGRYWVVSNDSVSGVSTPISGVSTPPMGKPVIYLYPEKVTDVTVKLDLNGKLGCTYPAYPKDGWKTTAYPNGKLIVNGEEYNYLFWEGKLNTVFTFDKGFCVKGSDTAAFLKKALAEMGLIPSEYNDFIVYWLPKMEGNAYNLISFVGKEYTDNAKLEITPKPDSVLRVAMVYQPLEKPITIAPQTFEKFERNGFTVVEWGGAEID